MLRQALASIRALEGDDLSLEILVGDNGGLPETRQIAEEFGAIHIPVAKSGASGARSAAMSAASGAYIAFLDDDDAWLPTHLRPQLALLDARPDLDAVVGKVMPTGQQLEPHGDAYPTSPPGEGDEMLRQMLSGWFPQIGSFVGHMRVREWSGSFDPFFVGGQDLDWMLRTARRRSLGFVDVPCVLFRSRAPGTYDSLQSRRIGYDRVVFFRHAIPEWRIWRNPIQFMRAYSGTLRHFYVYFTEAAEERAMRGLKGDAVKAMLIALSVFPLRGVYHLFRPSPMRRALVSVLSFRPRSLAIKSEDPA
jgi:glycosyltransferase involved in cell wall biosynthesis